MTPNVTIEEGFVKAIKRLPPDRAKAVISAIKKFQHAMTLPSLDFRQLKGRAGYFIIDAHRGDRIILRQDAPESTVKNLQVSDLSF